MHFEPLRLEPANDDFLRRFERGSRFGRNRGSPEADMDSARRKSSFRRRSMRLEMSLDDLGRRWTAGVQRRNRPASCRRQHGDMIWLSGIRPR
jgi:hypothetical protein